MKIVFLMFFWMFTHDPVMKQVSCQSQTKQIDGISVTKWTCPFGITFSETST